ncbi:Coiled-coil domain-containing protein 28B [Gryllus bimaculatus]|nr:Coiled-coil domain-containing protein 28B [Gryllus bimaculatus]
MIATMAEGGEECELQQLVPPDDDPRLASKSGEVTPPITPGISKVTHTSPSSPLSYKVSSGANSSKGIHSQGSLRLNRTATAPAMSSSNLNTPQGSSLGGQQQTRLLFVNEKLSRGPSLISESSGRQRLNPAAARLHNTKRGEEQPGRASLETAAARKLSHIVRAQRNCQHHSFLSDVTDVRRMETALLHLLEDFHSGKLRAFGKDCSMEQMTGIREQQERLARLHFDLGAQQELFAPLSDEGLRAGQENMHRLMESLEQLSLSIEKLHSFSSDSRESSVMQD